MPQCYALIKSASGELVSTGTVVVSSLSPGMELVEIDHQPGEGERWDAETRRVVADPRPRLTPACRLIHDIRAQPEFLALLPLVQIAMQRALERVLGPCEHF